VVEISGHTGLVDQNFWTSNGGEGGELGEAGRRGWGVFSLVDAFGPKIEGGRKAVGGGFLQGRLGAELGGKDRQKKVGFLFA